MTVLSAEEVVEWFKRRYFLRGMNFTPAILTREEYVSLQLGHELPRERMVWLSGFIAGWTCRR